MQINLIDVGAFGGLSLPWLDHHYIIGEMFLVDPRFPNSISTQCGGLLHMYNKAINEVEGPRQFYCYRKKECNSLFKISKSLVKSLTIKLQKYTDLTRFDLMNVLSVDCIRLDNIISKLNITTTFDFLKVDAQGGDLSVIKSMGSYLQDIVGIQTELYMQEFYEGAPLFDEAKEFLEPQGFECCNILRNNSVIFNDFLFFKKETDKPEQLAMIKHLYGIGA